MMATNVYAYFSINLISRSRLTIHSARVMDAAPTTRSYVHGKSLNRTTLILIRFLSKSVTARTSMPFITPRTTLGCSQERLLDAARILPRPVVERLAVCLALPVAQQGAAPQDTAVAGQIIATPLARIAALIMDVRLRRSNAPPFYHGCSNNTPFPKDCPDGWACAAGGTCVFDDEVRPV